MAFESWMNMKCFWVEHMFVQQRWQCGCESFKVRLQCGDRNFEDIRRKNIITKIWYVDGFDWSYSFSKPWSSGFAWDQQSWQYCVMIRNERHWTLNRADHTRARATSRSRVWSALWVGKVTCCERPKWSKTERNEAAGGDAGSSTWRLKSPVMTYKGGQTLFSYLFPKSKTNFLAKEGHDLMLASLLHYTYTFLCTIGVFVFLCAIFKDRGNISTKISYSARRKCFEDYP